jgi:hypothetical protein
MKTLNIHSTNTVRTSIRLAGAALAAALLAACATPTPKLDAKEGHALRDAKQAQKIERTPAQRNAPVPDTTSAEVQRAVTTQQASPGPGAGSPASPGGTGFGMGTGTSGTGTTFR